MGDVDHLVGIRGVDGPCGSQEELISFKIVDVSDKRVSYDFGMGRCETTERSKINAASGNVVGSQLKGKSITFGSLWILKIIIKFLNF